VPSLVVDGSILPILDVSQVAAAIGAEVPERGEASALAWDLVTVLDAWVEHLRRASWPLLVEPTPSRGRSLRNLTVNTFHPIELLPAAWREGRFEWDPDGDVEREAALGDAAAVVAYAERIGAGWTSFVIDHAAESGSERPVGSPRGDLSFADLLASQRWHAAFHYRQLTAFLAGRGVRAEGALRIEGMTGLELPPDVF
jgi:hypothetical protein